MTHHFRIQANPNDESNSSKEVSQGGFKKRRIRLISKSKGLWNPFQGPIKCIICWKPIEIDDSAIMECSHCHSKAHQEHMLRWLSKRNYCPYCNTKW
ncbi:MAG: hypothetical protein KAT16_00900 [Candidatus Heimdallarchaeota archaeon]|nr:hypothetical protein [Candidatus Heimdallarchaeota archaeon]